MIVQWPLPRFTSTRLASGTSAVLALVAVTESDEAGNVECDTVNGVAAVGWPGFATTSPIADACGAGSALSQVKPHDDAVATNRSRRRRHVYPATTSLPSAWRAEPNKVSFDGPTFLINFPSPSNNGSSEPLLK